jgi:glycosyltransferase involved in cell wall biosynthesis
MQPISVVIICKNEVAVIEETIKAAKQLSNNIVVVDSGSDDGTIELLKKLKVQLVQCEWNGFGPAKNLGIAHAKYDWILALDADERIDVNLINALKACDLTKKNFVYALSFLNYLGNKALHYGEWSNDFHIRVFYKKNAHWTNADVHEKLEFKTKPIIKKLKGFVHHKTAANIEELNIKMDAYAKLNAKHYFQKNKKNYFVKKYTSTIFNFFKNYFIKLGFLDGKIGLAVALENAKYTFKKYLYLQKLNEN